MRKLICWMLIMATLLGCMPACAQAAPELPDPGPIVKAEGRLIRENVQLKGVPCDAYGYSFNRGNMSFGFVLMAYEWKVTGLGFTWEELGEEELADSTLSDWYAISKNGLTAYLNLTGKLLGQTCSITLYVPHGMNFPLAAQQDNAAPSSNDSPHGGTSGGTSSFYNGSLFGGISGGTSAFYNGSLYDGASVGSSGFYNGSLYGGASGGAGSFLNDTFLDGNDSGSSTFYNEMLEDLNVSWSGGSYGDDEITCGFCHGTGTCPECHGSGSFRNPYTGSYLNCSCSFGDCPICDGTGKW